MADTSSIHKQKLLANRILVKCYYSDNKKALIKTRVYKILLAAIGTFFITSPLIVVTSQFNNAFNINLLVWATASLVVILVGLLHLIRLLLSINITIHIQVLGPGQNGM